MTTNASPQPAAAPQPPGHWTDQEKWVYEELLKGEIADLNERDGRDTPLDPRDEKADWPKTRILSHRFLKDIVLDSKYSRAIPHQGVRILGALFTEPLNFEKDMLRHILWLEKSCFKKPVNMRSLRTDFQLSFEGSRLSKGLDLHDTAIKSFLALNEVIINGQLKLNGAVLGGSLFIKSKNTSRAEFDEVDLIEANIGGQLVMTGSKFTRELNMSGIKVTTSVFMDSNDSYQAEFAEVNLTGATIGGQVAMVGSKFTGKLNMNGAKVQGSLLMRSNETNRAEFAGVDLGGATIGGQVAMIGSEFTKELNMDSARVEKSLLMRSNETNRTELEEVNLRSAVIGDQVDMTGSKFTGNVEMEYLKTGKLFLARGAEFAKSVNLSFCKIGGGLNLMEAKLHTLNLTSGHVAADFHLPGKDAEGASPWSDGGKLILRNASVGVLDAVESSWPEKVDLTGFTYSRLGGAYELDKDPRMDIGKIDWFKRWLVKQKPYSPQPYEQLATVLEKEGYHDKAKEILYESRERERKETLKPCEALMHKHYLQFLYEVGLMVFYCAEKLFIGYGLYNFRAFWWSLVLVLTGFAVLWGSGVGHDFGMPYGISYSLDMLLPIIKLREWHYTIDISTHWVRWYFYVHQLMGYVLALFLVAGLSGLTQRREKQ